MAIKAITSGQEVYIAAQDFDHEQQLFPVAGNIVFSESNSSKFHDFIEELQKLTKNAILPLAKLLSIASTLDLVLDGVLFFCGKEEGKPKVVAFDPKTKLVAGVDEYNSDTIDCKTSSSPLKELGNFIHPDAAYQIGVVSKETSLYLPRATETLIHPQNHYGLLGLSEKKQQQSAELNSLLVKYLPSRKKGMDEILKKVLDNGNPEKLEKKLERLTTTTIVKKDYGDFVNDFLSRETAEFFVGIEGKEQKEELAHNLERCLGVKTKAYEFVDYIAVECEPSDMKKVYSIVSRRDQRSIKSQLLHQIVDVSKARSIFVPELFLDDYQADVGYEIRAMSNLVQIGADEAQMHTTGRGVRVAVIDSGIELNHDELKHCFEEHNEGYDFVNGSPRPWDKNGHGTHVSGTIAGRTVGVAPDVTLYAVRVLNSQGYGSEAALISGIEWSIRNEADVINMSLGSSQYSRIEDHALQAAHNSGITIVAAAGNESFGPSYPASNDNVIAVAAVDHNNKHAPFSNVWDTNDISAPGVDIYSSYAGYTYATLSGTSMATPHVAGVAAMIKSMNTGLGPQGIETIIKSSAQKLGRKQSYGEGLVRADKAIMEVQNARTKLYAK